MATSNDDNMTAQLARLDAKVETLDQKVGTLDKKVENLDKKVENLDKKVEGLDKKVEGLDKKVEGLDKKVEGLDQKVDALANSTNMQFEAIRDDIKKLGEGYESGLKAISRQIGDLDKTWAAKWSIHDAALTNHAKRITTLEQHHAHRGDQ